MIDEVIAHICGAAFDVVCDATVSPNHGLNSVPSFATDDPPELQQVYESTSQTLADDPSNIEAHFARGVVCQSKGWHSQALADFRDVIRMQPDHARAWLLLSEVLSRLGEPEHAAIVRQQALELDPSLK